MIAHGETVDSHAILCLLMRHTTTKPFIKWVGGKGQLLPTLAKSLPPDIRDIEGLTYMEPFIGGGAMLFYMLDACPNISRAVINDQNAYLVRAYATVKQKPEALVGELAAIHREYQSLGAEEARKEFYLDVRRRFNAGGLTDTERTAYLIFLNRTCFNGLYRVNRKGEFNVPFGRYANPKICDADTIYADSEALQRVEIVCGDFEQTERFVTGDTFVYFDPPYRPLDATSNFNSYVKEAFGDEEQIRLKRYVDRLSARGCRIMLSYSDCRGRNSEDTFFDDLYRDYIIERVYASRAINSKADRRGLVTELLIRNYTATVSEERVLEKNIV